MSIDEPVIEYYIIHKKFIKNDQISFSLIAKDLSKQKAILSENRLIYIVKIKNDWLYVGEAASNLKVRLQRGFNAYRYYKRNNKKYNGYGGYKWIELFDEKKYSQKIECLELIAINFDDSYTNYRNYVQAIEGELVYFIRENTGSWPLCQNEIHFNNEYEFAKEIAKEIFSKILNK